MSVIRRIPEIILVLGPMDDPHGHDRDERPSRVDADIQRRLVTPGHEPFARLAMIASMTAMARARGNAHADGRRHAVVCPQMQAAHRARCYTKKGECLPPPP